MEVRDLWPIRRLGNGIGRRVRYRCLHPSQRSELYEIEAWLRVKVRGGVDCLVARSWAEASFGITPTRAPKVKAGKAGVGSGGTAQNETGAVVGGAVSADEE